MLSESHGIVHYGSCDSTYDGKEKPEFVEQTEIKLDKEITQELKRHLSSKSVMPTNIIHVQDVVGGNHDDTAFQFGASVSVELSDDRIIDFEVSICELICRKDTGRHEETILQQLTSGLEIISTFQLHLCTDDESNVLVVKYRHRNPRLNVTPGHISNTEVFVMGDLAFQAMAIERVDGRALVHAVQGQPTAIY